MDKIFLNAYKNVKSRAEDNHLDINLTQKARLMPTTDIESRINLQELYNDERENCGKYRLIFTINSFASNVLHNMKTEVLYEEGGNSCEKLGPSGVSYNRYSTNVVNTSTLNDAQAIRDTEHSHPNCGNLVYHCGTDIFNNHLLRAQGAVYPRSISGDSFYDVFNTVRDFQRDCDGRVVSERVTDERKKVINRHMYDISNLMSMEEAFSRRARPKDGWFGFNNVSTINIPNNYKNSTITINKLLNGNKACEFIDFYPDRTLFSFVPKINKARKRMEQNWDYCLTYPYMSDYETFAEFSGEYGIKAGTETITLNGSYEVVLFKTIIKHNVSYGERIRVYNSTGEYVEVGVTGTGNINNEDEEHVIRVYQNDLGDFYNEGDTYYIRKVSGNSPCRYYFRVFKKLVNENGTDYGSTINKLAFGENAYGDRTAELIFTDDIDISGLADNLRRPISEIFLTFVKTNRGHKEWYEDNNFTSDTIEYSHCFGEVTSGIETSDGQVDYNARKLHNVVASAVTSDYSAGFSDVFGNMTPPKALERDIKITNDLFLGDIVEFDPTTNSETVLEEVCHRFNTAQRETTNPDYYDIWYDELIKDDYDISTTINGETAQQFTVTSRRLNISNEGHQFPGNIQPEGYIYHPHQAIKIRNFEDEPETSLGAIISCTTITEVGENVVLNVADDYNYIVGDLFMIYSNTEEREYWYELSKIEGNTLTLEPYGDNPESFDDIDVVLTDGSMPLYATYVKGEQKFVWKNVVALIDDNELSETIFTNGRIYKHENINFFLRRQDPFAKYGLLQREGIRYDTNPLGPYKTRGVLIDMSQMIYLGIEMQNGCL